MNKKLSITNLLFLCFCFCALFCKTGAAQDKNHIAVYAGLLQWKDELNQNMVFNGPMIGFQYQRNWHFNKFELLYAPKIALGAGFNREMTAVNSNFVPVDISGIQTIFENTPHRVRLGLNVAANYSYQTYPAQHAAQLFWYGEIGLSPCVDYSYQWRNRKIKVHLQNSALGFVSRTASVSPYFYSFSFSDFFISPNQNMQFGSFDKYNHTNVLVEYVPDISKKHAFALGVEYINCYSGARFQSLNYYLQWKKSF